MDFTTIINYVRDYIPGPVIAAVVCVIMLVYMSSFIASSIEDAVEKKKGKQIKIFDHKKVWLSLFWCILMTITLAISKFIEWKQVPYYCFVILGASTFLYEAFLKKLGMKKEEDA